MTKSVFIALSIAAALAVATLTVSPALCGEGGRGVTRGGGRDTETYQVMKIDDEFKVVSTRQIADERKKAADDYKARLKEWQDAKRSDPTLKKPTNPVIKLVGAKFNTQKGAQDYADKLMEEAESKGGGKDSKKK